MTGPPATTGAETSTTLASTSTTEMATTTSPGADPFPVEAISVGEVEVTVWVAANDPDRARGLMDVEALPEPIEGMLFVFDSPTATEFWMLNTLIPLDIWWFDASGSLIGSTTMEPCETSPCPTYPSPGQVMWALETPAGVNQFPEGAVLTRGSGRTGG
jgi:uncharacterized membrane protein (UPF0127 family)